MLNYRIVITPITPSRDTIIIDNTIFNKNRDNYILRTFNFSYSLLKPESGMAKIDLIDNSIIKNIYGISSIDNEIHRGDIIQIYEITDYNTTQLFIGFINNIVPINSLNNDFIVLQCNILLQQLAVQNLIKPITNVQQISDDSNHELTQWLAPNISTLQDTLNNIFSGTVIQYAYQKNLITNIDNVGSGDTAYAFINGTGNLQNALKLTDKVLTPLSPTMKKFEGMLNILQPYQYIYFQDQYGIIRIQPLSINNIADSSYNFTLQNDQNNYNPRFNVTISKNITINQVITTAVNIGILDITHYTSVATVLPGLFQEQYDLLQNGYFTNQIIDIQNLPTQILQDPILLNIWYNTKGKGNPYIDIKYNPTLTATQTINGNKVVNQVLQLMAVQRLAASLVNDTILTVQSNRLLSAGVELPLGKIINFDGAGRVQDDFTQALCIGVEMEFGLNNNNLKLQLCKPYTIMGVWD